MTDRNQGFVAEPPLPGTGLNQLASVRDHIAREFATAIQAFNREG
ncbi:MAG: hypothetical protein WEE53_08990 [Acidimicrobiia bacterium]